LLVQHFYFTSVFPNYIDTRLNHNLEVKLKNEDLAERFIGVPRHLKVLWEIIYCVTKLVVWGIQYYMFYKIL